MTARLRPLEPRHRDVLETDGEPRDHRRPGAPLGGRAERGAERGATAGPDGFDGCQLRAQGREQVAPGVVAPDRGPTTGPDR
jgi:hypothetical protein